MKNSETSGLLSRSTVRRGGTYDFEEELKRLKTINNIERQLQRNGASPISLLSVSSKKRSFLDNI